MDAFYAAQKPRDAAAMRFRPILVSSPAEVALVRAFSEMTASDTPIRFQAFESFDELKDWLFDESNS